MKQGELIVRNVARDDGYWLAVLVAVTAVWVVGKALPQDTLVQLTALVVLVTALVRVTALRSWHIRRVKWTLEEGQLVVDGQAIPLAEIRTARMERGVFSRGGWTLIIRAGQTLRFSSLVRGEDRRPSIQSLYTLTKALGEAMSQSSGPEAGEA